MMAEPDSYLENWKVDVSEHLTEQTRKLADARKELAKAQRGEQMLELRADTDATVLSVSKISSDQCCSRASPFSPSCP